MILYRPVGIEELVLIFAARMRAFPPRLPDQPIFYPVLNEGYATQIARDWNTRKDSLAGYVTRFSIPDGYAQAFPVETVGARNHQELWIPADQLAAFNQQIEGSVAVIASFFGDGFRGLRAEASALEGKHATAQLVTLCELHDRGLVELEGEIAANAPVIFAHVPWWASRSFASDGVPDPQRRAVLDAVRQVWPRACPDAALPDH
jgi:hypothetical protein